MDFGLWILEDGSFIRALLKFMLRFFTWLYFLDYFPEKSVFIIHGSFWFFVVLLIFIFFDCLINSIRILMINILNAFSVGKLWVILVVVLLYFDGWYIWDEFDWRGKWVCRFDGWDAPGGCSASDGRFDGMELVDVLSSNWRFIAVDGGGVAFVKVVSVISVNSLHVMIVCSLSFSDNIIYCV